MTAARSVPTVFLSYARGDLALARRLASLLEADGHPVAMDVTDIAPGEDWQDRLDRLLTGAAKLVFLATPASVQSDACRRELDLALAEGKPVLPVLLEGMSRDILPEVLRRLHYFRFSGGHDVSALAAAVGIDLPWERRKADYLVRARDPDGQFHTQAELRAAESWAMSRPPNAAAVPDEVLRLIAASRSFQTRRSRLMLSGLTLAMVAFAALAAFGWQQSRNANAALTESLRREAMLSLAPMQQLSRDGWTFEALSRARAILEVFPVGDLPGVALAQLDEILRRAEAEWSFPVAKTARVFPGHDGAWILADTGAGPALTLLQPDGKEIPFVNSFPAPPVAVADFPEGPRAILADASTVGLDPQQPGKLVGQPEPLPVSPAIPRCFLFEGRMIFPGTCGGASDATTAYLNERGEFALLEPSSQIFETKGSAACLADDGAVSRLVGFGQSKSLLHEAEMWACRADPKWGTAIIGFWSTPGSGSQRTNFDVFYAKDPVQEAEVACLHLGNWQDVDARLGATRFVDLVLTEDNKVRLTRYALEYGEPSEYMPDCQDLNLQPWSELNAPDRRLQFPANLVFARRYVIDGRPEAAIEDRLMVYMPDRQEIRILRLDEDVELPDSETPVPDWFDPDAAVPILQAQSERDTAACIGDLDPGGADRTLRLGSVTLQLGPKADDGTVIAEVHQPRLVPLLGSRSLGTMQLREDACIALSPNERLLAVIDAHGLRLLDLAGGKIAPLWSAEGDGFRAILFLDDGQFLVGTVNAVERWSVTESDAAPVRLLTSSTPIRRMSLAPSGQRAAVTRDGEDGLPGGETGLLVFDPSDGGVIAEIATADFFRPDLTVGFEGEDRLYIYNAWTSSLGGSDLPSEAGIRMRVAALP